MPAPYVTKDFSAKISLWTIPPRAPGRRQARSVPRGDVRRLAEPADAWWLTATATLLDVLLLVGAASNLVLAAPLSAPPALSLVLLLAWAASVGAQSARGARVRAS